MTHQPPQHQPQPAMRIIIHSPSRAVRDRAIAIRDAAAGPAAIRAEAQARAAAASAARRTAGMGLARNREITRDLIAMAIPRKPNTAQWCGQCGRDACNHAR